MWLEASVVDPQAAAMSRETKPHLTQILMHRPSTPHIGQFQVPILSISFTPVNIEHWALVGIQKPLCCDFLQHLRAIHFHY